MKIINNKFNILYIIFLNFFFLFFLILMSEILLRKIKLNINFIDQLYDYNYYNALYTKKNTIIDHKFNDIKIKYTIKEYHNRAVSNDNINPNKKNILILGDSFSFGYLAYEEDTIGYYLNSKNNKYNFINSSIPGHGLSDNLRYFKDFCAQIKPYKTFIILNFPFIERTFNSNLFKEKNNELLIEKNKISTAKKLLMKNYFYNFLNNNSYIFQVIKFGLSNAIFKINKNIRIDDNVDLNAIRNKIGEESFFYLINQSKKITELILKEFEIDSSRCNSEIFFIYNGWKDLNDNKYLTHLVINQSNYFKKNKNILIDLSDELKPVRQNYNKYTIAIDGHPNTLGQKFLSELISNKILSLLD